MAQVIEHLGRFVPGRREEVQARLDEIDRQSVKPRTVRELQLGKQAARDYIQALDDEANILRAELAAL